MHINLKAILKYYILTKLSTPIITNSIVTQKISIKVLNAWNKAVTGQYEDKSYIPI